MMEVVVASGAIRRAKLLSNRLHQQTNTGLLTSRMFFLSSKQQCQSTERRKYRIPWTCSPQAHLGVFQSCLRPLKAPGYLGRGVPEPLFSPLHNHRSQELAVSGPDIWNSLQTDLHLSSLSMATFARHLKAHLFRNSE